MAPAVGAQKAPATRSASQESIKVAQSMPAAAVPLATEPEPVEEQPTAPAPPVSKPPEVTYEGGQLTIVAENSSLLDIMSLVRARTGADIQVPPSASADHFWVNLGPGPARKVLASLLNDSKLDYLIFASDTDPDGIRSVSLTPRTDVSSSSAKGGSAVAQGMRDSNRKYRPASSAPTEARSEDQPAPDAAPTAAAVAILPDAAQPAATAPATATTAAKEAQANADTNRNGSGMSDPMMHMLQNMYEERKQQMIDLQKSQSAN